MIQGRILLTRPENESVALAQELQTHGIQTFIAPMIEIAPEKAAIIEKAISQIKSDAPQPHAGLIFTSIHAVRAVADLWTDMAIPVYCVGSRTALTAKEHGFCNVHDANGNAVDLERIIPRAAQKYIYFSGKHISSPLAGTPHDRIVVYEACEKPHIPAYVQKAMESGTIAACAFFSARTAAIFMKAAEKQGCTSALKQIKALCISDSVIKYADKNKWQDVQHASAPNGDDLKRLVYETMI